jgi:PAS domain S-box-containing protein
MDTTLPKILLLGDTLIKATFLTETLTAKGKGIWDINVFTSVDDALCYIQQGRPHIVLIDAYFLDAQTLDTIAQIHIQAPDIPIVVLVDDCQDLVGLEAIRRGAQAYLAKRNISPILLKKTLQHAIEQIQTEQFIHQQTTALHQSETRLHQFIANVPGMIYQFVLQADGRSRFSYVSSSCIDIFELEASAVQQNSDLIWQCIHPEDCPTLHASIMASAETLNAWEFEWRIVTPSGQLKWIRGASRPFRQMSGDIIWDGVLIDISDRKQAEIKIMHALEREKELNQLKSDLVTVISHEFRTPLSTISLSSELIQAYGQNWPDDKRTIYFGRIKDAVRQMTHLLEDTLVMGRINADTLRFNPIQLDLPLFCQNLMNELQSIVREIHQLQLVMVSDIQSVCLDPYLLRHIITHLITNAIKYSPNGGLIDLTVARHEQALVFQVRDEGVGIAKSEQPLLFDPFYRGSNVSTISGIGLGLAIVKQCVDMHRGSISVTSDLDMGSLFEVVLPINPGEVKQS